MDKIVYRYNFQGQSTFARQAMTPWIIFSLVPEIWFQLQFRFGERTSINLQWLISFKLNEKYFPFSEPAKPYASASLISSRMEPSMSGKFLPCCPQFVSATSINFFELCTIEVNLVISLKLNLCLCFLQHEFPRASLIV